MLKKSTSTIIYSLYFRIWYNLQHKENIQSLISSNIEIGKATKEILSKIYETVSKEKNEPTGNEEDPIIKELLKSDKIKDITKSLIKIKDFQLILNGLLIHFKKLKADNLQEIYIKLSELIQPLSEMEKCLKTEYNNELKEKITYKLSIDYDLIFKILAISSGVFLLGGYIYNSLLLNYFGIDASLYFSLPDYIASSLNYTGIAILFSVSGIFLLLLFIHFMSKKPISLKEALSITPKNKYSIYFFYYY